MLADIRSGHLRGSGPGQFDGGGGHRIDSLRCGGRRGGRRRCGGSSHDAIVSPLCSDAVSGGRRTPGWGRIEA
jgi:hypothetical protein